VSATAWQRGAKGHGPADVAARSPSPRPATGAFNNRIDAGPDPDWPRRPGAPHLWMAGGSDAGAQSGGCQIANRFNGPTGVAAARSRRWLVERRPQLQRSRPPFPIKMGPVPDPQQGSHRRREAAVLQIENPSSWASHQPPSNSIGLTATRLGGVMHGPTVSHGRIEAERSPSPCRLGHAELQPGPGRPQGRRASQAVAGSPACHLLTAAAHGFGRQAAGPRPGQAPNEGAAVAGPGQAVHRASHRRDQAIGRIVGVSHRAG